MTITTDIEKLIIGKRVRKDLGDVMQLVSSIEEIGLLHPIVVYHDMENSKITLLAGYRRVEAFKLLHRQFIPATEITMNDTLKAELHENSVRKDFTFSEMRKIRKIMKPIIEKEAEIRMKSGKPSAKLAEGDTRDKLANLMGVSHGTYDKIEKIDEAIEKFPEKYADIEERIDKGMSVDYANRMINTTEHATTPTPNLPKGEFEIVYIDIPWEYDLMLSGAPPYKTMSLEEIKDEIKIPAHKDCIIFMWATNPKLLDAIALLEFWGFEYKTNIAWVKMKNNNLQAGTGYYVKGSHELLLIATKGSPGVPPESVRIPSVVFAERTKTHSEKPKIFYEIIEKYYPAKLKIEMFARNKRDGWTAWGDSIDELS